jgi:YD repeat-containing protein
VTETSVSGAETESLTWDDAGRLSQLSGAAGTTGYLYDAGGNLLLQQDHSSTTLYLPGEEITLAGSTLSGIRYYTIGGVTVAARLLGADLLPGRGRAGGWRT